jgi:hypothetical protein
MSGRRGDEKLVGTPVRIGISTARDKAGPA